MRGAGREARHPACHSGLGSAASRRLLAPTGHTSDQRGVLVDQPQPVCVHHHGQAAAPHRAHDLRERGWQARRQPCGGQAARCRAEARNKPARRRCTSTTTPLAPAHLRHRGQHERVAPQARPHQHRVKAVQPGFHRRRRLVPLRRRRLAELRAGRAGRGGAGQAGGGTQGSAALGRAAGCGPQPPHTCTNCCPTARPSLPRLIAERACEHAWRRRQRTRAPSRPCESGRYGCTMSSGE